MQYFNWVGRYSASVKAVAAWMTIGYANNVSFLAFHYDYPCTAI
jgi:hypothetical protein